MDAHDSCPYCSLPLPGRAAELPTAAEVAVAVDALARIDRLSREVTRLRETVAALRGSGMHPIGPGLRALPGADDDPRR